MADDVDQGYTWETEYERTWYVQILIFVFISIKSIQFAATKCHCQ